METKVLSSWKIFCRRGAYYTWQLRAFSMCWRTTGWVGWWQLASHQITNLFRPFKGSGCLAKPLWYCWHCCVQGWCAFLGKCCFSCCCCCCCCWCCWVLCTWFLIPLPGDALVRWTTKCPFCWMSPLPYKCQTFNTLVKILWKQGKEIVANPYLWRHQHVLCQIEGVSTNISRT